MLEVLTILKRALEHPEYGVNQQLQNIQTLNNEQIEPVVRILSESEDDETALDTLPADWPVLILTLDNPAEGDGEPDVNRKYRDYQVPVSLRYFGKGGNVASTRRQMYYVLRAAVRCWDELSTNARVADRTFLDISLIARTSMFMGDQRIGDLDEPNLVAGAVIAIWKARDSNLVG